MPVPFFFTPFVAPTEQEPINVLAPIDLFWDGNGFLNGYGVFPPQTVSELGVHVLDVTRAAANERDVIAFVVVDPATLRVNLEAVDTVDADNDRFIKMKPLLGDGKVYDVGKNAFPITQAQARARLVTNAPVYLQVQMRKKDGTWDTIGGVLARSAGAVILENLNVPRGKQEFRVVVEITNGPIISGTGVVLGYTLSDVLIASDDLLVELI